MIPTQGSQETACIDSASLGDRRSRHDGRPYKTIGAVSLVARRACYFVIQNLSLEIGLICEFLEKKQFLKHNTKLKGRGVLSSEQTHQAAHTHGLPMPPLGSDFVADAPTLTVALNGTAFTP